MKEVSLGKLPTMWYEIYNVQERKNYKADKHITDCQELRGEVRLRR